MGKSQVKCATVWASDVMHRGAMIAVLAVDLHARRDVSFSW
jgi:hypothetical protein